MNLELIPTSTQTATITQTRKETIKGTETLILTYTIDTGKYSWRSLLYKVPLVKSELEKLRNNLELGGFFCILDPLHEYFYDQFIGLRFKISVARYVVGQVIRNIIIEHDIATNKPDYDVTKEKTEDHFNTQSAERKLPFNV